MDCAQGLLNYFSELEKNFHCHFTDVLENFGEATVHDLRVNMKRQLAFFHLLEILDPTFSTGLALDAYGKLYKKAGKARDVQVAEEVVRPNEDALRLERLFSAWLAEEERRKVEKLRAYETELPQTPVRRLGKLVRNRIEFLEPQGLRERFLLYFGQVFTNIRYFLRPENRDEAHFHDLRRLIKELFYNIRLINTFCGKQKIYKKDLKALDSLQEQLGLWHDFDFTLALIREVQKDCPPPLVRRLEKAKQRRTRNILRRLEKIPEVIDRLEQRLDAIFKATSLEMPKKKPARPRRRSPTHPSFKQINVSESTK